MKSRFFYPLMLFFAWCGASWHWLSGESFIPWDSIDAFFPQVSFITSSLLRGESPTWNPLIFGGLPVMGDPQGMIFTPHVLAGLVSGSAFGLWIFDATTLACMLAGALCLYIYARSHGSTADFATIGAIVFLLGGYGTSRLQHVPQIISYALLPILLLTLRRFLQNPRTINFLALSATGVLLALNPNHVVFLIPTLLGPVLALEILEKPKRSLPLIGVAASALIVLLAATPSLSAIIETVAHSTRANISLQNNVPASLPAFSALSIFIPGLFLAQPGSAGYWGPADLTESYLYIGVIPTFLIFAGISRRQAPSPLLALTLSMGVVSFLFAMGTHGPIFPWLFENIPGFSLFRRPSDGAYFLTLHLALAIALINSTRNGRSRSMRERLLWATLIVFFLAFCTIELLSYATQANRLDSLISVAVDWGTRIAAAITLIAATWLLSPKTNIKSILSLALIIITTIDLTSTGRLSTFSEKYDRYGVASMYRTLNLWEKNSSSEAKSLRELKALQPEKWRTEVIGPDNMLMALGFPMTQGYNPIKLRRYHEVFGAQFLSHEPKKFTALAPSIDSEAYRWLGMRFLVLHGYILDHPEKFGELGKSTLLLRNTALAAGGREMKTHGTYRIIEMQYFHERATVVEDGQLTLEKPKRRCKILSEKNTSGSYLCDTPVSGKVVIGDSFAPGWMACVNGRATPVEPFIHSLRSVAIPPGRSSVRLSYQPIPFLRDFERCS